MWFTIARCGALLTGFRRHRGGNIAMLWALLGAALVGMVGLTVDFTRALSLRSQMQNAVDGAVLVAERGSNLTEAQRTAAARAFFDATLGRQPTRGEITFRVITLDSGGHRVEANVAFDNGLSMIAHFLGRRADTYWNVAVSAEAQSQASPPIEVVMALDNTGSMRNDMQTLRDGAEDLANFLLGLDGDSVSVGLVPFVAQVNIGTNHAGWLDQAGNNPLNGAMLEGRYLGYRNTTSNACTAAGTYPTTFGGFQVQWVRGNASYPSPYTNTGRCYAFSPANVNIWSLYANLPSNAQWGGCVEARLPPYDINDSAPNAGTPATMFVPFFSLDDGGDVSSPDNNWITSTTYDRTNPLGLTGNPTWNDNTATHLLRTLAVYKYRSGVPVSISTSNSSGRGPNRGCPTPIVPLTTDRNTVVDAIRAMDYWNGGGTNQIEGLAWAWRVISPGSPFTEGRPYNDPSDPVRKVIVLFTDGDNTSLNSNNATMESDYAALAYRSLWRTYQSTQIPTVSGSTVTWSAPIPAASQRSVSGLNSATSDTAMVNYMNARQALLCTAIKNAGVEIYTIGFRITAGGTADLLLEACATQDGEHFFHADNQSQLLSAFRAIGSGIGDLRLTR